MGQRVRRAGAGAVLAFLPLVLAFPAPPARAEIFVTTDTAIRVFADDANGDVAPLRSIVGAATGLEFAGYLALDLVHRELWVSGDETIRVFDMDATGDVAPKRSFTAPSAGMAWTAGVALDPGRDEVCIADWVDDLVFFFDRTANGADVLPARVLGGANTTLDTPSGCFVDVVHDEIWISHKGAGATQPSLSVFDRGALTGSGTLNIAPKRTLTGGTTEMSDPRCIQVDLGRDQVILSDRSGRISFWPRTANGDVAPTRQIVGGNTQLGSTGEISLTRDDEILAGADGYPASHLAGHPWSASGDAVPSRLLKRGQLTDFR